MKNIEVNKIIDPIPASDGAGVKLKRSIGVEPNYFDPFLMLDEFGSENSEDYIAGFPPHPHRGIETVTYMLNGDFEHEDSTGGKGKMTAGDVQWMKLEVVLFILKCRPWKRETSWISVMDKYASQIKNE